MKLRPAFLRHSVSFVLLTCLLSAVTAGAAGPNSVQGGRSDERIVIAGSGAGEAKADLPSKDDISTICIEAKSGLVISEHNSQTPRPPASMVKMMHFLLVAEGLREGKWRLDTPVTVTENGAVNEGTRVFLKADDVFTVDELMAAMAVASANDAGMAIAEGLWGSEEACLKRMNERAAELGMTNTTFRTAHGLPADDGQEDDMTTALDMAILAQYCVLAPAILKWTSQKEIRFRPTDEPKASTNKLLARMPDCDGLKTGYTRAAGFCVTATAERDDIRLIAVVMGTKSVSARFDIAEQLLEQGFAAVCRKRLMAAGDAMEAAAPVCNCEIAATRLVAAEDLWVVVTKTEVEQLEVVYEHPRLIQAPARAGTVVGEVRGELAGHPLGSVSLVLSGDIEEAGWRWKLTGSVRPRL